MKKSLIVALLVIITTSSCFFLNRNDDDVYAKPFRIALLQPLTGLRPYSEITGIEQFQIHGYMGWVNYIRSSYQGNDLYILSRSKFIPDMLESYEISDGGKQFTGKFKKGITFHNGEPLTVEDFTYTLRNYISKEFESIGADVNINDINIKAIDNFTFVMQSPKNEKWYYLFTQPILCKKYEESRKTAGVGDTNYIPMGAGPYKFESYDKDKKVMKLKLREDIANPKDKIKNIEFHYFTDFDDALFAFLHGKIDYIFGLNNRDTNIAEKKKNVMINAVMDASSIQIILNNRRPPFDDEKVRNAISIMIDRNNLIVDRVNERQMGIASDTNLHLSPPVTTPKASPQNAPKAMEILHDAGWERIGKHLVRDGKRLSFEIIVPEYYTKYIGLIRYIVGRLTEYGISCRIRISAVVHKSMMNGEFDSYFAHIQDSYILNENKRFYSTRGEFNMSGISDARLDELFSDTNVESNDKVKKVEIQQILKDKMPVITLFYPINYFALSKPALFERIAKEPQTLFFLGR